MSTDDVLKLARILAEVQGVSLSTIGRRASGGTNPDLFHRLAARRPCSTRSVDIAAAWFVENWPRFVIWPEDIPRPPPSRCAAE